ncbi:aromatic-ring-hydroxylating dioxygenase subunit beta [Paraburkholderia acidisoli]|uniref:Phenylpropionate dioxygenase n=1 Tax=Paraburkholderia acidisoli TaxID=2571748 RepID=A0A7Z2JDC4_9BURK|nr:aromatic-ring-hydroxylating dioxygenase subunit beta [Paraburkholderia acidisoli]QGZ61012.1 phenylpropionate dioxygenase [Paraburkholderia acidisoli]
MTTSNDNLIDFVYREARLIDEKQFDAWYELFAENSLYWIPLAHGQQDGLNHASLMYEDRLLLKLRIERLKQPRAYSQQPESRCQHVLQRPEIEAADPDGYRLRTPFFYAEARGDEQLVFTGVVRHHLVDENGALRMREKRIELLNCDAALPSVQLFL